ncbi:MAG: hypothetical protein Q8P41_13085 [Pseudomonadota bacterium]|nr:hypothetical protein [Pseudomonadota bacterium]
MRRVPPSTPGAPFPSATATMRPSPTPTASSTSKPAGTGAARHVPSTSMNTRTLSQAEAGSPPCSVPRSQDFVAGVDSGRHLPAT